MAACDGVGAHDPAPAVVRPWGMRSVLGGAGLRVALALTLGLSLGAATVPACAVTSIFTCADDAACVAEAGEGAVCDTASNYCQVPNANCTVSGFEWYDRSSDDLAGKCLEDTVVGGTGDTGTMPTTDGSGSGGDSSPADSSGDSSPPADSSGGMDTNDPSTTSGPGDTGMMDSTGAAGVCDMVFGGVADYMLCNETPTECTFHANVDSMGCDAACASVGATCVAAQFNDVVGCTSTGDTTCDDVTFGDGICTCAIP